MINTLTPCGDAWERCSRSRYSQLQQVSAQAPSRGSARRRQVAMPRAIIWRIAPAFRRAAQRRCNACRRTCRACRRAAQVRCKRRAGRRPRRRPDGLLRRAAKDRAPTAAGTAPAPTATTDIKPAAPTAAAESRSDSCSQRQQPSGAQISAIRSACRSDYQKSAPASPTGGAPALQCLEKNKSKLSAACADRRSRSAATGGTAAPAATSGATAAAQAHRNGGGVRRDRAARRCGRAKELLVVRSACGADVHARSAAPLCRRWRPHQCSAWQATLLRCRPPAGTMLAQFAAQ